jgi:hypothetical protein
MSLPIRYSPSGPIISNNDGGEAVPGPGFTLRIVDRAVTAGALVFSGSSQVIPETGPVDFILEMLNPRPGLRYYAQLLIMLQNGAAAATWSMSSQWSVDNGAFGANHSPRTFNQAATAATSIQCTYLSVLTLGSALPSVPVAENSTSLRAQFVGSVSVGGISITPCTLVGRIVETL